MRGRQHGRTGSMLPLPAVQHEQQPQHQTQVGPACTRAEGSRQQAAAPAWRRHARSSLCAQSPQHSTEQPTPGRVAAAPDSTCKRSGAKRVTWTGRRCPLSCRRSALLEESNTWSRGRSEQQGHVEGWDKWARRFRSRSSGGAHAPVVAPPHRGCTTPPAPLRPRRQPPAAGRHCGSSRCRQAGRGHPGLGHRRQRHSAPAGSSASAPAAHAAGRAVSCAPPAAGDAGGCAASVKEDAARAAHL